MREYIITDIHSRVRGHAGTLFELMWKLQAYVRRDILQITFERFFLNMDEVLFDWRFFIGHYINILII